MKDENLPYLISERKKNNETASHTHSEPEIFARHVNTCNMNLSWENIKKKTGNKNLPEGIWIRLTDVWKQDTILGFKQLKPNLLTDFVMFSLRIFLSAKRVLERALSINPQINAWGNQQRIIKNH